MKEQVSGLIEILNDRVHENLVRLKQVELEVKSLLAQPVSDGRSSNISLLFEKNKLIIQENQDALKIQLQLIAFLNKYYPSSSEDHNSDRESSTIDSINTTTYVSETNSPIKYSPVALKSILHRTISGDLAFDSNHPLFDDLDFYNDLLKNYISMENYEMCAFVKKIKQ